jgi:phosphatidylinositol glycan class B
MENLPWSPKLKIDRFEWIGLFLFVLGHSIAAYFSFGYNHPDEHFQILEFAAYFTGINTDTSILPWEYRSQIRPWFQPFLHAIPMKVLSNLGVYQAFNLAAAFRVFYAALNLAAIWSLWSVFKKKFQIDPKWFLLIGTLWFFPYLHVRNSSENLSGIFLTFAFTFLMSGRSAWWSGLAFGFAFLARFQIALGLAGMGIVLLLRDRKITLDHLKLLSGFLMVVVFGAILDRIGYGNWVFTPYLYFKVNLVDGVAATYNPYPWYQYFIWILQLNPVISLPLFAGIFLYARKEKRDPLAWFVISFFLLHLFITNKEYRFLFPVMNLVALMVIHAYQGSEARWFKAPYLPLYLITSTLGLYISSFHGAAVGALWCVHAADRHGMPGETWLSNRDFVAQFSNNYYRINHIKLQLYGTDTDLASVLPGARPVRVLLDAKIGDENTQRVLKFLSQENCKLEESGLPNFIFAFKDKFPILQKVAYRALFYCTKEKSEQNIK